MRKLNKKIIVRITLLALFCFGINVISPLQAEVGNEVIPSEDQVLQIPEYAPGELIVKLKQGKTLEDIKELNAKYNASLAEKVFKLTPTLQETLSELKNRLTKLGSQERDQWYWQLDKDTKEYKLDKLPKEYKDYLAKIEKAKEELQNQIQAQEELISHLEQRQKKAPEGVKPSNLENIYLLKRGQETDILNMAEDYQANPSVEYAEPNYIVRVQMVANDPYYSSSNSWGQGYDDLWGLKKLNTALAWDIAQGNGVIVAVVDTGIDYNHIDIAANIWTNSREIAGNGKDDDNNGYIDDVKGFDFANNDPDPKDDHGHGTHCAGTIAAIGNNRVGIIGVAPRAKVMAVKGLNAQGSGLASNLAASLIYAANNGADVLSASWAGYGTSKVIADAVNYAHTKGCVVVAAAGNDNSDTSLLYPANLPNVITVAAITPNDQKCDFSNWGYKVDVAAPGGGTGNSVSSNILSLLASNSYISNSQSYKQYIIGSYYLRLKGTSMACPYVSGVAALILSKYPDLTNKEVRGRIAGTTVPLSGNDVGIIGTGKINAYYALASTRKPYFRIRKVSLKEKQGDGDLIPESGEKIELIITVENLWKDASLVKATLSTASGYISSLPVSYSEFGSISQGELKDNSKKPFVFQIGSIKYETPINFKLSTEADGITQILNFEVYLGIRGIAMELSDVYLESLSISGSKVVWKENRNGNWNIYLYDLNTRQERKISGLNKDNYTPRISGNKVVYTNNKNIYLYDLNTNKEIQITNHSNNSSTRSMLPSIWANKIVWMDNRNSTQGNSNWDIFLYDLETQREKQLTNSRTYPVYSSYDTYRPVISGNKIVWQDYRNGNSDIYLYDVATNREKQITKTTSHETYPIIFDNRIVWEQQGDLYLYDLATNTNKRLTTDRTNKSYLSAYGNKIVWVDGSSRDVEGNYNFDIFIYDLATNTKTQLTKHPATQTFPVISAQWIAWLDYRNGRQSGAVGMLNADIYVTEVR